MCETVGCAEVLDGSEALEEDGVVKVCGVSEGQCEPLAEGDDGGDGGEGVGAGGWEVGVAFGGAWDGRIDGCGDEDVETFGRCVSV